MKDCVLKFLKTLLVAFSIWFGLTCIFIALNSSFDLSQKFVLFPIVALILPVVLAAFYVARFFYKARPKKEHHTKRKASLKAVPPPSATPFAPTGDPQLDAAMAIVDTMEGHDFEQFCSELLERCGFRNIHVTKGSGDQGVDIIAIKNGVRYAFQCKRYSSKLGNKPVQEVHTGKQFYSCQKGVVITNNYFTRGAEDAARRVGVELWDRDTLIRKMGYRASAGQSATK